MTKTSAKPNPATDAFESVKTAFENMQAKLEVPAAAREFVQRAATSGKEHAETAHTGAAKVTDSVEKLATSLVGGYADFARSALDMTLANVQHSLATVEKLAAAKSVNEVFQLQADFVRENARANFDRARTAAETARTTVTDGFQSVQAEILKLYGAKAA